MASQFLPPLLRRYTLKADNPSYMPHEYSSNAEASVQFTEAFLRFTEEYVSYL